MCSWRCVYHSEAEDAPIDTQLLQTSKSIPYTISFLHLHISSGLDIFGVDPQLPGLLHRFLRELDTTHAILPIWRFCDFDDCCVLYHIALNRDITSFYKTPFYLIVINSSQKVRTLFLFVIFLENVLNSVKVLYHYKANEFTFPMTSHPVQLVTFKRRYNPLNMVRSLYCYKP